MTQKWLFLDTHVPGRYRLGWLGLDGRVEVKTYVGRPAGLLRRLFGKERQRMSGAKGVCVVAGPGSFSAIRMGVLYANLLARLFRLPLMGVQVEATRDLALLAQKIAQGLLSTVAYVTPIYDAEPNITWPRSV